MAAFLHAHFAATSELEFLDANQNIIWYVRSFVDDDGKLKAACTGSPWKSTVPTLTGTATMLVRVSNLQTGTSTIRVVESFESMRLIGWFDDLWKPLPPGQDRHNPDDSGPQAKPFSWLLADMSGNAYCVWHAIPWLLAVYATAGKYGKRNRGLDPASPSPSGSSGSGTKRCRGSESDMVESDSD